MKILYFVYESYCFTDAYESVTRNNKAIYPQFEVLSDCYDIVL